MNGSSTLQSFTVHVTDVTEPGIGHDTFSITLSGGYSASGILTRGNIQIRLLEASPRARALAGKRAASASFRRRGKTRIYV